MIPLKGQLTREPAALICVAEDKILCPIEPLDPDLSQWKLLPLALESSLPESRLAHDEVIEGYRLLEFSACFELQGYCWMRLRSQLDVLPEAEFSLLGRALQWARWYWQHRFCGSCGAETEVHEKELARVCAPCELHFYPRLSPCVMILIVREHKGQPQCLLALHGHHRERQLYTILAGFIEAGETAEQAARREAKEEVGLELGELTYLGSQAWPFPGQLMLAFTANYMGGELTIDHDEIVDANWYNVSDLPLTPPEVTLSGKVIKQWCDQHQS